VGNKVNAINEDAVKIWEYVPIDSYKVPSSTVTHTVKGEIKGLLQKLRKAREGPVEIMRTEEELEALFGTSLECIVAAPDWRPAVAAMESAFFEWMNTDQMERSAFFLVGPPAVCQGSSGASRLADGYF
jgi:hypothetical protein